MHKILMRERSRNLRKNSTDAEQHLWYYLRAKRLGYKFKRQVPIGSYIVDFLCYEKRLIIELDGGQHQAQIQYDTQRTEFLQKKGFQVLRFWNNDVFESMEAVLTTIIHALSPALSRDTV